MLADLSNGNNNLKGREGDIDEFDSLRPVSAANDATGASGKLYKCPAKDFCSRKTTCGDVE